MTEHIVRTVFEYISLTLLTFQLLLGKMFEKKYPWYSFLSYPFHSIFNGNELNEK